MTVKSIVDIDGVPLDVETITHDAYADKVTEVRVLYSEAHESDTAEVNVTFLGDAVTFNFYDAGELVGAKTFTIDELYSLSSALSL